MRVCAVMAALLALGLAARPAAAQAPVVAASVDRASLSTGEQLTLSVVVDAGMGEPGQPALPALDGFQLLGAASGTQTSTVNGVSIPQVIYRYTLQPQRAGQLIIEPITVSLGGQSYQTAPITVTVMPGAGQPGPVTPAGGSDSSAGMPGMLQDAPALADPLAAPPTDPRAVLDQLKKQYYGDTSLPAESKLPAIVAPESLRGQDYLVEASVDNPAPYQGEQIVYTVRVYQAIDPFDQIDYRPPSFTGFWSKKQPERNHYRTQAAGRDYRVSEWRTVLFPAASGQAQIAPAHVAVAGGLADSGVAVASPPLALDVKQLPAGAPPGFQGAVGQFAIHAAVDRNAVKVGDPVTERVSISGLGNFETLPDPQWPEDAAWRAFEGQAQTSLSSQGGKLGGTRTYTRTLMPTAPGAALLPAIELAYFDPAAGQYHAVSTDALPVSVAPDAAAAQADQAAAVSGAGARASAAGTGAAANAAAPVPAARPAVRPIQAAPAWWQAGPVPLPLRPGYWLLWGLPLLVLGGQYLAQRRQAALQAHPALQRSRLAARQARQALAAARKQPDDAPRRAEEILTGYLAAKMDRPVAGLTHPELAGLLRARGIDPALAARAQGCLLECQAARYAPAAAHAPGGALLDETAAIIEELEQGWNGGRS